MSLLPKIPATTSDDVHDLRVAVRWIGLRPIKWRKGKLSHHIRTLRKGGILQLRS
jgi:hypothetical protein